MPQISSQLLTSSVASNNQPSITSIELTTSEIYKVLCNINANKASGLDNLHVPGRIFKEVAAEISPSLCQLFNFLLAIGHFPSQWKLANLSPLFKKDDPTLVDNYRPISLLCVLSKNFERCVFNQCYPILLPQFYHFQHGFLKGRSTSTSTSRSTGIP